MITTLFILTICLLAELFYEPRLDITENRDLLLWYGHLPNRKNILIIHL